MTIKRLMSLPLLVILFFIAATLQAQTAIDTTLGSNPVGFITEHSIEAMTVSITLILSYLAVAIPGLKNIKGTWIRSIAVGILVVVAVVQFKFGWFTEQSFSTVLETLFPTFAYSGLAWNALKLILGLFKIDIVSIQKGLSGRSV